MQTLYQILGIFSAGLIVWILYRTIKEKPESLSRAHLSQSLRTLGFLAIGLILFTSFLILLIRR
jgi:hypothetical protein